MLFLFFMGCSDKQNPDQHETPTKQPTVEAKSNTPTKEIKNTIAQAHLYKKQAANLITAIESNKTASEVLTLSEELTETGLRLIPQMIATHPECKAYLEAIQSVGPTLKDLPLSEIESGYHSDGKLPPMPSPECYHGKDLVVHPATVSALAKEGLSTAESRENAKHEIAEVIGHLKALE
jgi:hypothetical protein